MISDLFFAFWFFLPVGVAILVPVFAANIRFLKPYSFPLDFHTKFRGKRVFGDNKTIRGLMIGVLASILVVYVQVYLYSENESIRKYIFINYETINPFIFGLLCGLGALLGDGVKSFFKRQVSIKEGESWFPFDQIDHILGGIIFTYFYIPMSFYIYAVIVIVWFLIHMVTSYIGYLLKFKKYPI